MPARDCILSIIVVRILIVEGIQRVCEFYNPSECALLPYCNRTQVCSENGDESEKWHCYALWTNSSGAPQILMKGCWLDQEYCYNRNHCSVTEVNRQNNFCCCDADLCNAKVDFETLPVRSGRLTSTTHGPNARNTEIVKKTLLISLCPLLVLAIVVIAAFYAWRRFAFRVSGYKAPSFQAVAIGDKVGSAGSSKVELLEVVADGCFGPIWKGKVEGGDVAVKIMNKRGEKMWLVEKEFYAIFETIEQHENILKFVGAEVRQVRDFENRVGPEYWLMTEFQRAGSLHDFLKDRDLGIQNVVHVALGISRGLAFLHSSSKRPEKMPVAHRDLKSKNVLLKEDMSACISDFGLSLVLKQNLTDVDGQVGSVRYMAPEVLDAAVNSTVESFLKIDIYSCSLIFWELLSRCSACGTTGNYLMPFEAEVGPHPSIDVMQNLVFHGKVRPHLKKEWWSHELLREMCRTVEDCWDHDAEARLMSVAVEHRMSLLHQEVFMSD